MSDSVPVAGAPATPAGHAGGRRARFGASAASLALLTAFLWGGTAVATRFAVEAIPPVAVGGVRFGLATLFMLAWCRWERAPLRLRAGQWWPCVVSGVLLYLQIATFNWGQARTTTSHAILYINTYIFWVAAYEHFISGEIRLTLRQLAGLLVAAAGVLLLVGKTAAPGTVAASGRDVATLTGDGLMLLSALILAIKVVQTKHVVRKIAPGTLTFWHDVVGTTCFAAHTILWEPFGLEKMNGVAVWMLLFLGIVVSGFCFAAHAWLLQQYSASIVSAFSFATPVFGVALAVVMRGDVLSPWLLVAGIGVALGIVLVTVGGRRPP